MVYNRALASMPLVFSLVAHIDKGKGYSTWLLISVPAAESTSDNTLLRRHRERFSWWDECFNRRKDKIDLASGTSADSNILKIYGMLDRTNGDKHYYQVLYCILD